MNAAVHTLPHPSVKLSPEPRQHQWLYLHHLDTIENLRKLVAAYVADHNGLIPRLELGARTPDEVYAQAEIDLADRLATAHTDARRARVDANRALQCASVPVVSRYLSISAAFHDSFAGPFP